ncbi:hypothetical protein FACS1894204_12980 [Synergistales bacterium]|nr:hypothetical protein FACS1894204_12980 [Synergistales bacterium]
MSFHLRIYENNHYADEEEAHDYGKFPCYDDALARAKEIVCRDVFWDWVCGHDIDELFSCYTMFGEDPVIISDDSAQQGGEFSAWTYAETLVGELKDYLKDDTDIQTIYQSVILFAGDRHSRLNQTLPDSNIPYAVHLSNVCMEVLIADKHTENFNLKLAVQTALLHDILEDTDTTSLELEQQFGGLVVFCVKSLTKNKELPKAERIADSLERIKSCPKEVWAVKLADRITNLQKPPKSWSLDKIAKYREEAKMIHSELRDGNHYLAERLSRQIETYRKYCEGEC